MYVQSYTENVGEHNSNLVYYCPSSISENTLFSTLADRKAVVQLFLHVLYVNIFFDICMKALAHKTNQTSLL